MYYWNMRSLVHDDGWASGCYLEWYDAGLVEGRHVLYWFSWVLTCWKRCLYRFYFSASEFDWLHAWSRSWFNMAPTVEKLLFWLSKSACWLIPIYESIFRRYGGTIDRLLVSTEDFSWIESLSRTSSEVAQACKSVDCKWPNENCFNICWIDPMLSASFVERYRYIFRQYC